MRRNLWTRAVLLAVIGGPSSAAAAAPPDDVAAQQRAALSAADTPPARREEAARRLLAARTRDGVDALVRDLQAGPPPVQLAIARVVADAVDPAPSLLKPLAALLNAPRSGDAAAEALAAYAGTPSAAAAVEALGGCATSAAPTAARVASARALRAFQAKQAAAVLIRLVSDPDPVVRQAAAESLADLSGERDRGPNAAQWQAWWAGHANQPEDAWRAYLGDVRAGRAAADRSLAAQLDESVQMQHDDFYALPVAQRAAILTRYLDARSPTIRRLGADLVQSEVVASRPVDDAVLQRVRDLVPDDDPSVRREAILALTAAVDQRAGPVLVAQLSREPDVDLRKLLIRAVGKIQVLAAAPVLMQLLNDPRDDVAAAAARALGEPRTLGIGRQLKAQQPKVAAQVALALRNTIKNRPTPPGGPPSAIDDVKANCVGALPAVSDAQTFNDLRDLLVPNESVNVRVAALQGFASLGDHNADDIVAASLSPEERSPAVRLAAAQALQVVGQQSQADQLKQVMDQDRDPDVRNAAWEALKRLLERGSSALLQNWAARFPDDPDKRLTVRQYLDRALAADGPPSESSAANDQEMAQTLRDLRRPAEEIGYLQAAIDYYLKSAPPGGGTSERLYNLVGQMLDARLAAKQYPAAAAVAAAQLKVDPSFERVAGPRFRDAADQLKATDPAAAHRLIDAALSMQPPLSDRFVRDLQDIRDELGPPSAPGRR